MLLNAATFYRATKDTADVISQEKPLKIGNKIWMYDPNKNKALAHVLKTGRTQPTYQHIFGHLEDTPFANWVEFAGADESSQGTTGLVLTAGHGARVTTGSRIYWVRTKEIMRLTAAMSTDTTAAVARNFGRGTAASLLLHGDKGLILPPAFEQGFTTGLALSNARSYVSFATTEVSYPVAVTNIEQAERNRGGSPFETALAKSWKQSKDQMEGELFFGAKVDDTSTYSHPISASQGLSNFVSTHTYSANKISRMDLWDIIAEWDVAEGEGVIMCSKQFKAMVTNWGMGKMIMDQDAKKDGMNISRILTPHGEFPLVVVDLFNEDPHLMGTVFFVPNGRVDYAPLIDNISLDIAYNPISRDEVHSKEGEIYGAYGWEFFEEEKFAKLEDLRFAA